jgi:hypothetical protein
MASADSEKNRATASRSPALWVALGIGAALLAGAAARSTAAPPVTAAPLRLAPAVTLSDQKPDFDGAAKSRIVGLGNGMLVVAYGDAVENKPGNYIYDLQADVERPARDIFVRTCDSVGADCTDPRNWTDPVNISNTAAYSSIDTDWTGDTDGSADRTPFHGDSGKPNIFGSGDRVVITWVDAYCPGDADLPTAQRTVTYLERNDREVPFRCVYAAHAQGDAVSLGNWTVKRLTDGSRDANQDVSRGMQSGGWAVIWQEDPRGLQPGEAEGPGDGASGARASLGTDVWYAYSGPSGKFGTWQTPVRLTDNWTGGAGKPGGGPGGGGGGGGGGESVGNNLSNPAIWSDGVAKELRGTFGSPIFDGDFLTVADVDWYLQQYQHNEWQAETLDAVAAGITPFSVDQIDWGDNLEARGWPADAQVRVETVLYQDMSADAMTGFEMRSLFGEGSTEMWGTNGALYSTADADAATNPRKSAVATVYSRCARLTIQKLFGTRENPGPLAWDPELGQWTGNIEPPDFNRGVWEAGEGPGDYSAEINVRGRLIYGYNWRVAELHPVDTAGDYRLTFSVDGLGPDPTGAHCDVALNTDLTAATILPGGGEGGGAVPVIDTLNNVTYIDVRILPGDGTGGGGSGGGGCGGGGPGDGQGGGHGGGAGGGGCQEGGPGGVALSQAPGNVHDGEEGRNPIKDAEGNLVDRADIETGSAGASRPNLGLVSNTAIVAYEETKGAGGGQGGGDPDGETAGKFVRYHQFPFQSPPGGKAGCIVSDPQENGRRVRLVTQGQAGASGLRWAIFWRQGIGGQGASADIVLRRGNTDFSPTNLYPAVDPGCETSVYEEAIALGNAPPLNVSSNTPIATDLNLADATGANSVENARAHRALLRGDDLYVGYTYTGDDALAQSTRPRANYNFWMRHFDAVAGTWTTPKNLSLISNLNVDVKEPRLMGTPGSGPNCPDDPEDCQNTSIFFAAWGTERKDPVTGGAVDLDIFITYTTDKGGDFVPALRIARGDNVNDQAEDQLRSTPDGSRVFSVWNERNLRGGADTRFTVGTMELSLGPPGKQ